MEKSHVAQVADELVKLGFTAEEADHLAREKHRAHSDQVKTAGRSPGEIAEEIAQRETEPSESVSPEVPEAPGAVPAGDPLEAFERTIPPGR